MDALPEERQSIGLQAVFRSVFPISDFRETATLDFVEYHIGNWQCKCGNLEGLKYLRTACKNCDASIKVDPLRPGETLEKQPANAHVSSSDLDAGRDFIVTVRH